MCSHFHEKCFRTALIMTDIHLHVDNVENMQQSGIRIGDKESHTQVILIQLNFLHEWRHHKGERLSVEVVQRVADKHGQKYSASVVSITCCRHGCRFSPVKEYISIYIYNRGPIQRERSRLLSFDRLLDSELCDRIHCSDSAAYKWRCARNQWEVNGQLFWPGADLIWVATMCCWPARGTGEGHQSDWELLLSSGTYL